MVGMAVGLVPLDKVLVGRDLSEGDVLVGLASSGIHSNGLTLARRVLFEELGLGVGDTPLELEGRTVGEELLEPTRIYVSEVLEMMDAGLHLKALFHITGDGLLNLCRIDAPIGWRIERLPQSPPIFGLIQRGGRVREEEMCRVFNLGIGFFVAVPEMEAEAVISIAARHGTEAWRIARAVEDRGHRVFLDEKGLVSREKEFYRV